MYGGEGRLKRLVDQDIPLGQVALHRRLGRHLGELAIVSDDALRLDLPHLHVVVVARFPDVAKCRVIKLCVQVVFERRGESRDIVIDIRRMSPGPFDQLNVLLFDVVDEHVEKLFVIQRPTGLLGRVDRELQRDLGLDQLIESLVDRTKPFEKLVAKLSRFEIVQDLRSQHPPVSRQAADIDVAADQIPL